MTMELIFAGVLAGAFILLTVAFHRPEGRAIRTRGPVRTIRRDVPTGP